MSTRKPCQTTSFLLARRAGVRLLLLLLVFQGLSSGRYPSSRAGQEAQGDGRSLCRSGDSPTRHVPRVRRMRTAAYWPRWTCCCNCCCAVRAEQSGRSWLSSTGGRSWLSSTGDGWNTAGTQTITLPQPAPPMSGALPLPRATPRRTSGHPPRGGPHA